jgi:hypothetical protein
MRRGILALGFVGAASAGSCHELDAIHPTDDAGTVDADGRPDSSNASDGSPRLDSQMTCPGALVACDGSCIETTDDPQNCGGCGVACSGTCKSGRCLVVLAAGQISPALMAVDDSSVYWINSGTAANMNADGAIMKAPIAGGAPTILVSGATNPGLAVGPASVYCSYGGNPIMSVPLDGGVPATLVAGADGGTLAAIGIAVDVDAKGIYWADWSGIIGQVPLSGGPVTTLASGLQGNWAIAVGATSIFWTNLNATGVMQVPLAGGAATMFAPSPVPPYSLAADSTSIYWTQSINGADGGTVMEAPLDGGAVMTLASSQEALNPLVIAADGTSVYWTDRYANTVSKVLRGGGPVTTLASGQAGTWGIAVDATSVYWTNITGGSVMKLTPK